MKKFIKPNAIFYTVTIQHVIADSSQAGNEQKEPVTDGGAAREMIWTSDTWKNEW